MATTITSDDVLVASPALTTAPVDQYARGMGWLPDWPDQRDYTADHPEVKSDLETLQIAEPAEAAALPATADLRAWFSPIEDQGQLGSCTANAGMGVLEYYERRAFGKHIDGSRLFLYKVTRDLLGWTGDTGAFLRTTMGALRLFGAPPEKYWPYVIAKYDIEPTPFLYAFGADYRAVKYYRLDPPGTTPAALLSRIKTNLAAGVPAMFGFTVYASISQADTTGKIPYPALGEAIRGGHAIVVAGYDDSMVIKNTPSGPQSKGAFLIRNSWGAGWGDHGYGWLPYDYVVHSLATDWWSLISANWVSTNEFGL